MTDHDELAPDRPASDRGLRDLVKSNPGQCSFEEYELIRDTIAARAPCNLLVFGVGRDTPVWLDANRGGRSVFLESKRKWIDFTRERNPDAEVVEVSYGTLRLMWRWLLHRPDRLMLDLPDEVLDTSWDVILVDGPKGKSWYYAGRMKSIYTASVLASTSGDTDVLVHDCHRPVEDTYSRTYLGDARLAASVRHLRLYRVP